MGKKKFIWIFFIIIILIAGLKLYKSDTITLEIENLTNKDVDNLKLTYTGLDEDISVPMIKSDGNIKFKVRIDDKFTEGQMIMYYTDKNNKKEEFCIIGYFEKGFTGNVGVDIVKEDGKIQIVSDSEK